VSDDTSHGFDPKTVEGVAADHGVDPDRLADLLADHQRLLTETPGTGGVAGLVYEWRRAFGRDPVLRRSEAGFHLAVEPHVWREYVAALDADEREATALRAVHAAAVVATSADDRDPMVVWRA
jgi:hypothetical protein